MPAIGSAEMKRLILDSLASQKRAKENSSESQQAGTASVHSNSTQAEVKPQQAAGTPTGEERPPSVNSSSSSSGAGGGIAEALEGVRTEATGALGRVQRRMSYVANFMKRAANGESLDTATVKGLSNEPLDYEHPELVRAGLQAWCAQQSGDPGAIIKSYKPHPLRAGTLIVNDQVRLTWSFCITNVIPTSCACRCGLRFLIRIWKLSCCKWWRQEPLNRVNPTQQAPLHHRLVLP
jgi:hypothetical protein